MVAEAEVPTIEVDEEIGEDDEAYECDRRQGDDEEEVRLLGR